MKVVAGKISAASPLLYAFSALPAIEPVPIHTAGMVQTITQGESDLPASVESAWVLTCRDL